MSHVARLARLPGRVYRWSMKRSVWIASLAGVAGLLPLAVLAGGVPAQAAPPSAAGPAPATCVDVQGQASFASVGYDHLVKLTNNCKMRVACSVRTNVNPDAAHVSLAPSEATTVVTWRGSPAREFTPDVTCFEQ